MFNRYWRSYPWGMQLLLFMLTVFTLYSFSLYLILAFVPRLSGFKLQDITLLSTSSAPAAVRAALFMQSIFEIGSFALPALLFAQLTHPRLREYLNLRSPGKKLHWLIVTLLMVGYLPLILWLENWARHHMNLGPWAESVQRESDNTVGAFLTLNSAQDIILLLCSISLIPAISEELIFRGVILRLLHKPFLRRFLVAKKAGLEAPDAQRMMVVPVVFSALIFALCHPNPYGFAFIFISGCLLALIYNLTGSLLCSMWAHFLNNGVQVLFVTLGRNNTTLRGMAEGETLPAIYPVLGLLVFAGSFYLLVKHQTPLAPDWSDDFRGELPEAEEEETPA